MGTSYGKFSVSISLSLIVISFICPQEILFTLFFDFVVACTQRKKIHFSVYLKFSGYFKLI